MRTVVDIEKGALENIPVQYCAALVKTIEEARPHALNTLEVISDAAEAAIPDRALVWDWAKREPERVNDYLVSDDAMDRELNDIDVILSEACMYDNKCLYEACIVEVDTLIAVKILKRKGVTSLSDESWSRLFDDFYMNSCEWGEEEWTKAVDSALKLDKEE